jgi:hypothetical protein
MSRNGNAAFDQNIEIIGFNVTNDGAHRLRPTNDDRVIDHPHEIHGLMWERGI